MIVTKGMKTEGMFKTEVAHAAELAARLGKAACVCVWGGGARASCWSAAREGAGVGRLHQKHHTHTHTHTQSHTHKFKTHSLTDGGMMLVPSDTDPVTASAVIKHFLSGLDELLLMRK